MTELAKLKYSKIKLTERYEAVDILFFVGFFLYVFSLAMDLTMWTFSDDGIINVMAFTCKLLRYISYAIMIVKILYNCNFEYTIVKYLIFLGMLSGLAFLSSRDNELIFYLLLYFAAKGVKSDYIIVASVIAQFVVFMVTVIFSRIALLDDYIRYEDDRKRHFLGFQWATSSAILFMFIVLELIYLGKGRIKLITYIVVNLINIYLYILTDSRMAALLVIGSTSFFFAFGHLINKIKVKNWFAIFMSCFPFFAAVGSIYLHKRYVNEGWMGRLNVMLSSRLRYGNEAIKKYGIGWLGKKIKWVGYGLSDADKGKYNYVDCSYLRIAIEYGIVFLLCVLTIYAIIIYRAFRNDRAYLAWIAIFILAFSITESRLLNFTFNPFTLLAFASFSKNRAIGEMIRNKTESVNDALE